MGSMGLDRFTTLKFNENHDEKGLFSSSNSSGDATAKPATGGTSDATAAGGGVLAPGFKEAPFKNFAKETEANSISYDGFFHSEKEVADMVKSCRECGYTLVPDSAEKVPGAGDSFVMTGPDGRWMQVQTTASAAHALGNYQISFNRGPTPSDFPFKNDYQKQRDQKTRFETKGENMNIAVIAAKAVNRGAPAKKGDPGYVDTGSAVTTVSSGIDYSKVLDARPYFEAGPKTTSPEMAASLSNMAALALEGMPVDERERFRGQIEKYRTLDQVPPALMAVMSAWG